MQSVNRIFGTAALVCLLSGSRAPAFTTNYWQSSGGYSGDYTNTSHWSAGSLPGNTDLVWFTNGQSSAYTVKLTGSVTNGPIKVVGDSVKFDLAGYRWFFTGWDQGISGIYPSFLANPATTPMTVTFSSSTSDLVGGGNVMDAGKQQYFDIGPSGAGLYGRYTKLVVDNSLGYGVKMYANPFWSGIMDALVTVSGSGSEYHYSSWSPGISYGGWVNGGVLVTNGGLFSFDSSFPMTVARDYLNVSTVTVVGASSRLKTTAGAILGMSTYVNYGDATVIVRDGGTWYDGATVWVGADATAGGVGDRGRVLIDNATFVGQTMLVGSGTNDYGELRVVNGAVATFSNRLFIASSSSTTNNLLVLSNSTIQVGGSVAGSITNRGTMRALGNIVGLGASPALVRNENSLEVGGSVGTLTLTNANLELAAGSTMAFELGPHNPDGSPIVGGGTNDWVHIYGDLTLDGTLNVTAINGFGAFGGGSSGTNMYTLFSYTGTLVDNVLNIGSMPAGTMGWLNIDTSAKIVSLFVIPEPSTTLLLVGGALMLFRSGRGLRRR